MDIEGRVRLVMEGALTARDRVGVQDFLLLENHNSEAAFIENLRRRLRENLIYVTENFFYHNSVTKRFSLRDEAGLNVL